MQEEAHDVPAADLAGELDFAWARSAATHELSAHGRSVQRRLGTPAQQASRPALWKRLRFALYRLRARR